MKTVIVVSNYIQRTGLKTILSDTGDIKVVGEGSNVNEGIELILTQKPDIALIDLKLGEEDGLQIINKVRNENSHCKFIVLSNFVDCKEFKRVRAYEAEGYILKDALAEELVYSMRIIQAGKKYYDANLLLSAISTNKPNKSEDEALQKLTQREREVLTAVASGLSNMDIAVKLNITEYTVKKHVSNILAKLDLNDRTQAALYANAHGVVSLSS